MSRASQRVRWEAYSSSGLVMYDFDGAATGSSTKLSLLAGQRVRIVEKYGSDWFRGCVQSWGDGVTGGALGIFPVSFVLDDRDRALHDTDPGIADLVLTLR